MGRNISDLDILDLQNQGQVLYRQKKYEDALKCFDQAILSNTKSPITVYDNRAATYTKLGKLKPALRDGKHMIEEDKSNCTGYLRTGKILQLLEKPTMALDIYQLGLRRTHPSDPNAKLLQGLHDQLAKQCHPAKAVDPFQALPMDIVDIIISYLAFRDTVRIVRVSKAWRYLLSSMPRLWTDLDFSTCKKQPNVTAVRQYVKNAQGTCSVLRLNRVSDSETKILCFVALRCRGMRDVRLSSGFLGASLWRAGERMVNLQTLIVSSSCEISSSTVSQLLDSCLKLERAEFHGINARDFDFHSRPRPKMHTLVMNVAKGSCGSLNFSSLLAQIENIRSLTLRNWNAKDGRGRPLDFSHLPLLEYLDIDGLLPETVPHLPKSIRTVSMTRCKFGDWENASQYQYFWEPQVLPNLSSFSIGHSMRHLQLQALELISINKEGLRDVDLSGLAHGREMTSLISDGDLNAVENLRLRESDFSDKVALLIPQNIPRLKNLDLARTRITGVGVKALIIGLEGKLEWLGLDECQYTSVDAVQMARSMGVKVSYNFPDLKGGKKIRLQA